MVKLSVVLVTHNEEDLIKDCLESVKFADEIVVIDTNSSDRTVEIAKRYTQKILIRPNFPNPNVNMNIGFEAASGNWIFLVSPDERVSEKLEKEIQTVISSPNPCDGYWMPRKNYFLGRWLKYGGHYPDWQLRLFKRGKGKFPEKSVHEFIKIEGKVGYLREALTHYPYRGLSDLLQKIRMYGEADYDYLKEKNWQIKFPNYFWFFVLRPFLIFCRGYLLKLGFLDGVEGLIFAGGSAFADFYRSAHYWHQSCQENEKLNQ